jgi:hypothetical protein
MSETFSLVLDHTIREKCRPVYVEAGQSYEPCLKFL